jgi:hypothetical protein
MFFTTEITENTENALETISRYLKILLRSVICYPLTTTEKICEYLKVRVHRYPLPLCPL